MASPDWWSSSGCTWLVSTCFTPLAMSCAYPNVISSAWGCVTSHPVVSTALVLVATAVIVKKVFLKPKLDVLLIKNPVLNRVYLFQFGKSKGLNASPFCTKVEAYLRVMNVDYEAVENFNLLERFSRHKLPVIQYNQELIQDSAAIIKFLEEKVLPTGNQPHKGADHDLSEKDKDTSAMVTTMVENGLAPIVTNMRWKSDLGWPGFSKIIFAGLPFPLSLIVPYVARKNTIKLLYASGIARYTDEDLTAQAAVLLGALSRLLGKNKFILGDKFHTVDASVYGTLYQYITFNLDTPVHRLAQSHDNLVSYVKRIEELAANTPHRTISYSKIN